jgi:hypothetical protein
MSRRSSVSESFSTGGDCVSAGLAEEEGDGSLWAQTPLNPQVTVIRTDSKVYLLIIIPSPADHSHQAANRIRGSFFSSVTEEHVIVADGAETAILDRISSEASVVQLKSIGERQVEMDTTIRLRVRDQLLGVRPDLAKAREDFRTNFEAAGSDRRTDRDQQIFRTARESLPHGPHRSTDNTGEGATPTRVNDGSRARPAVSDQYRQTIGSLDGQEGLAGSGDKGVTNRRSRRDNRYVLLIDDPVDVGRMDLLQRQERAVIQFERHFETTAILDNIRVVILAKVAKIESGGGQRTHAATAGCKGIDESTRLENRRDEQFQSGYLSKDKLVHMKNPAFLTNALFDLSGRIGPRWLEHIIT